MAEVPTRAGPTLVGTSPVTIYTAGAAGTWTIMRSIVLANVTANTITATVGIGTTNTDTAAKQIVPSVTVLANEVMTLDVFIPLAGHASTPDLVYADSNAASSLTVTLGLVTGP